MILQTLSRLDHLAIVMILLVTCVGVSILLFSRGYMHGDTQYPKFCRKIILLIIGLIIMASTDNLLTFLLAWGFNNALLTTLIIHKSSWKASYHSGLIAGKNFLIGFIALAIGFFILYQVSGEHTISKILNANLPSDKFYPAAILILIGAMTQSAIWPFHRWLISSLNAPTPVSAMMHAGLVNGGGFLLARFAPL